MTALDRAQVIMWLSLVFSLSLGVSILNSAPHWISVSLAVGTTVSAALAVYATHRDADAASTPADARKDYPPLAKPLPPPPAPPRPDRGV